MTSTPREDETNRGVLASSAVMAAGTVVSRVSGYLRGGLLAAAIGNGLHADQFNIGNTIPNMLYILLAGGVFNAVLVPQLVRAMKADDDGGEAYTNRIVTLAALFLGVVTVLLVATAPLLMRLFLSSSYDCSQLADQRASAIAFARYCLPQVFFYGMFVLVGQILNARSRFGPMMWAPIANNVISVLVLVVYLVGFGPLPHGADGSAFTGSQELLLGLGSTAGIAVQFLILVPYLRRAGFTYRPRFDFRRTGLGHTLRLGVWTVGFVVVNQIAYTVVVRLASSGTTQAGGGCGAGPADATGYSVYAQAFLFVMVPHAIITVSLATAILPRLSGLAAEGDLAGLARSLASTLRTALTVVIPFALLLPIVAHDTAQVLFGYGATSTSYANYVPSMVLFGPGVVFFTVHYLMLRGFYALELTRRVFWIQCVVAATNVAMALALVHGATAADTSPALVAAYGTAYAVGSGASYLVLRRSLGGLETPTLVRFLVRLLIAACLSTLATAVLAIAWDDAGSSHAVAAARLVVLSGLDVAIFLVLARLMRIAEVTEVLDTFTRRLPGRG